MTAVEKIIAEINNELQTLESLHGKEIFGRKVGLAFAKRVAEQAKEMEKEQIVEAWYSAYGGDAHHRGEAYYIETFKTKSCCDNGIIICPGCDGDKKSEFGICAGCIGVGEVVCGKCNGNTN